MAQFTPSKKTIKDFNDGEEYLNRIDVVQADTINNLVEGLLYAQESGGTTMLTEGREFGKVLQDNDYFLDVIGVGEISTISAYSVPTLQITKPVLGQENQLRIDDGVESKNNLVIEETEIYTGNVLKIGE